MMMFGDLINDKKGFVPVGFHHISIFLDTNTIELDNLDIQFI